MCRQLGQSAIEIAAKKGHVDIVKVLIDRGADTKATNNVSSIYIQTDLK
jgi:ankyrin repeat protein